jgi:hypothetical protein
MSFKFQLTQSVHVRVRAGNEAGEVIAHSEYTNGTPNQYLVRHFDAAGDQAERWYEEDQIDEQD